MDDIKNKRKRNIVIEAAMKDIKCSLTGKHARGILGNIEQNLRYAYRRGYEDAQEEFTKSNVQKYDDSLIKTNNELVSESDVIYRRDVIDEIARWDGYLDEDMIYRIQLGLKRLPSAEPKTADSGSLDSEMPEIKGDRTKGGMIYRQDVIDAIDKYIDTFDCIDWNFSEGLRTALNIINDIPQTEFKIYVVSWITCGVPVVTAFNNYDAAKKCYDAFKTKEGKCLDRVPVYSNFIDYGEIENE